MAGEERNLVPKVQIKAVEKIYEGRNGKTVALNGVNLDIYDRNGLNKRATATNIVEFLDCTIISKKINGVVKKVVKFK